jgi:hypothetical protein
VDKTGPGIGIHLDLAAEPRQWNRLRFSSEIYNESVTHYAAERDRTHKRKCYSVPTQAAVSR